MITDHCLACVPPCLEGRCAAHDGTPMSGGASLDHLVPLPTVCHLPAAPCPKAILLLLFHHFFLCACYPKLCRDYRSPNMHSGTFCDPVPLPLSRSGKQGSPQPRRCLCPGPLSRWTGIFPSPGGVQAPDQFLSPQLRALVLVQVAITRYQVLGG